MDPEVIYNALTHSLTLQNDHLTFVLGINAEGNFGPLSLKVGEIEYLHPIQYHWYFFCGDGQKFSHWYGTWRLMNWEERELANGGKEVSFDLHGDCYNLGKAMRVWVQINRSPILRHRFELRTLGDEESFCLNDRDGQSSLRFGAMTLQSEVFDEGRCRSLRLNDWQEGSGYHPSLSEHAWPDSVLAPADLLMLDSPGGVTWICGAEFAHTAHEERFYQLEAQADPEYVHCGVYAASPGAYYHGEEINAGHPLKTVWVDFGAVETERLNEAVQLFLNHGINETNEQPPEPGSHYLYPLGEVHSPSDYERALDQATDLNCEVFQLLGEMSSQHEAAKTLSAQAQELDLRLGIDITDDLTGTQIRKLRKSGASHFRWTCNRTDPNAENINPPHAPLAYHKHHTLWGRMHQITALLEGDSAQSFSFLADSPECPIGLACFAHGDIQLSASGANPAPLGQQLAWRQWVSPGRCGVNIELTSGGGANHQRETSLLIGATGIQHATPELHTKDRKFLHTLLRHCRKLNDRHTPPCPRKVETGEPEFSVIEILNDVRGMVLFSGGCSGEYDYRSPVICMEQFVLAAGMPYRLDENGRLRSKPASGRAAQSLFVYDHAAAGVGLPAKVIACTGRIERWKVSANRLTLWCYPQKGDIEFQFVSAGELTGTTAKSLDSQEINGGWQSTACATTDTGIHFDFAVDRKSIARAGDYWSASK